MTVTAFVPARSGSKRVPGKNIKLLAGKPLVLWTLKAFAKAPSVDKVIFSTDSEEYWRIATDYLGTDKLVLDDRTAEEAGDKVKIFDYLKSAHAKIFKSTQGTFVMGLPTVPFRNAQHVESAIGLHKKTGKPVFSAVEYGFPISFAFTIANDGDWNPVSTSSPMVTGNTRSQDQVAAYHPNGAIYVRAIADLAKPDLNSLYDGATPFLMDRKYSVDIDNEADFVVASAMVAAGLFNG
ncbi:MAG: acylneuraminate cytidylyltransferase family protein [Rhodobacteraceae bacterium]|nr:acylneuraminate cytidylyltransferase family protein [Paracoccaceae bacterium]